MKPYVRTHPEFSLCGLPCGLCSRFHTQGSSRCPGCGGMEFHKKYPACPVITCSKRHGDPAFCCECTDYPCGRYRETPALDSFISYARVRTDLDRIKAEGPGGVLAELGQRMTLLKRLLERWDDGRSKAYYCLAAQRLPLHTLVEILATLGAAEASASEEPKERARMARARIAVEAERLDVSLTLRRNDITLRTNPEDSV